MIDQPEPHPERMRLELLESMAANPDPQLALI